MLAKFRAVAVISRLSPTSAAIVKYTKVNGVRIGTHLRDRGPRATKIVPRPPVWIYTIIHPHARGASTRLSPLATYNIHLCILYIRRLWIPVYNYMESHVAYTHYTFGRVLALVFRWTLGRLMVYNMTFGYPHSLRGSDQSHE